MSLYTEEDEEDMNAESGADQGPTSRHRIEEQRSKIKSAYLDTCEKVLGKMKEERSEETWKKIDKRQAG